MSIYRRSAVILAVLSLSSPVFAEGIIGSGNFDLDGGPAYGYGYTYGGPTLANNANTPGVGVDGSNAWEVNANSTDPTGTFPTWWGFGGGAGVIGNGGPNGIQNRPTVAFGLEPAKFFYQFDMKLTGTLPATSMVSMGINISFRVPFEALPNDPPDGDLTSDEVGVIEIDPTPLYNAQTGGFQRISGSFAAGTYRGDTSIATLTQFLGAVNQIQVNLNIPNGFDIVGNDTDNIFTFDNVIWSQGPIPSTPTFVVGDFNFDGGVDASDIDPFVVAANEGDPFAGYIAASQDAFALLYPGQTLTSEIVNSIGDFNGDGGVDASDIDPFVVFANNGGAVSAIPEPAALGLLAPVGLLLSRRRR